jgi:hypothetical protein
MKKILFIIILINFFDLSYSQVLKGYVKEISTENKISFVSVYFNETTVGTITNADGYFELDITKHHNLPVTVSALGYRSVTLNEYSINKIQFIYLTPMEYELDEVVITKN